MVGATRGAALAIGAGTTSGVWQPGHFTRRPAAASGACIRRWHEGHEKSIGMRHLANGGDWGGPMIITPRGERDARSEDRHPYS